MGDGERANLLILIGQLVMLINMLMEELEPDKYDKYRKWIEHMEMIIDLWELEYP